jgi:hypothetical protein
LSGSFTVASGASPEGYTVTVTTNVAADTISATFTIMGGVPIFLNPTSAPRGTAVTVSGLNYQGNTCSLASSPSGLFTSSTCTVSSGTLRGGFTVASSASVGTYTVTVTTNIAYETISTMFTVTSGPPPPPLAVTVSTNKSQYSPGEIVTVQGQVTDSQNNPISGAGVAIQVNDPRNNIVQVQLVSSDQSGGYLDSLTLPMNAPQGQYTTYVSASKPGFANGQTQTQFNVTIGTTTSSTTGSGSLLFSPNTGPPGIVVNFPGSGPFSPSDVGPCSITANPSGLIGGVLACTISPVHYYLEAAAFVVASTATPGPYTVTVKGSSGDSISGIFTVTRLNLMLQPSSGPVGTVVTVSGSGFASIDIACVVTSTPSGMVTNSDPCIISNGQPNSNSASSGVLTPFKFTVGNVEPGSYLIQVKGTAEFDVAQATFTVSGTTTTSSTTQSSQSVTMTVTVTTTVTSLTMSSTESGLSAVTKTYLQISSNSTISNLQFDSQRKLINFTASGPSGTIGSTTIVFAKSLINGVPVVLIDNGHVPPISLILTSNSTHYFLSITYPHSTHSITVGGSNTISEFDDNVTIVLLGVLATVSLVGFRSRRRHGYS